MSDPVPLRLTASELEQLPFAERLEACRSFIERATALVESAGQGSAEASDDAGLVTVRVSGAGTVDEIRLERPTLHATAGDLETAVVAAVGAARARLTAEVTGALAGIQVDLDGWAEGLPTATTQADQVTEGLRGARQRLAGEVFAATSVQDEARAVVGVDGELRALRLAPLAVRQTDRHTLGELILDSVRQAQSQAGAALAAELRESGVLDMVGGLDAAGGPDGSRQGP